MYRKIMNYLKEWKDGSLKVYLYTYEPAYTIKLSTKNFGMEHNIKTVPLYSAFCI